MILSLMKQHNIEKAKPSEIDNSLKVIKLFNFLIENKFFL